MSEISIDENGKLRVLNQSIFKESELVSTFSTEFMDQVHQFVELNQSNLSSIQEQVDVIELKRSQVIGYKLLANLEKQKRQKLEKQFKDSLQISISNLEQLEKQLQSYRKEVQNGEE